MAGQAPERAAYFQEGCFVDAVDSSQHWLAAFVKQVDASKGVLVRFDGWSNKWNEWLSLKSSRLAPFRRHSRKYGGQQSSALRDWVFSPEEIAPCLLRLEEVLAGDMSHFKSAYDVTQFFRGHLFTLVDNLLGCVNLPEDQVLPVLNFCETVLKFSVMWINQLPARYGALYQNLTNPEAYLTDIEDAYAEIWPELFCTVERLLGCDPRLMDLFNSEVLSETVLARLQCNETLPEAVKAVPLLAHFISVFISTGGFVAIAKLIQDGEKLSDIQTFVDLYTSLAKDILNRLSRFSEKDQKFYDKVSIQSILRTIYAFAATRGSLSLYELAEKTEMTIAMHLLQSKFLDKRVKGINNLTEGIFRAVVESVDQFIWFKESSMLDWLNAEKVKETILTDRPHIEILKRSQQVFSFLAERGELNQADLESLWDSTIDKHESYVRTVYDLVSSLATVLSKELLDVIYAKLKQIDLLQCPDYAIVAMKQFTQSACLSLRKQFQDAKEYCLKEFLHLLGNPEASQVAINLVSNSIVELLRFEALEPFRHPVLKSLLSGGLSGRVQSVSIVLKLLTELPADVCRDFLDTEDAALIENVIDWILAALPQANGENDLKIYLLFLELVASKGVKARVRDEDIKHLWTGFTSELCPSVNTEVFFAWLRHCLEIESDFLIANEMSIKVYDGYLCHLEPETILRLKIEAFLCFQQFFLYVNGFYKNLKWKEDYVVSRSSDSLFGLDTLILFALHTSADAILTKAIRLLSQLNTRVLKEAETGLVTKFVSQRLQALADFEKDPQSDQYIERNLRILTGIIEAHEYIITSKPAVLDFRDWQTAYYRIPNENSWKTISTSRSETIGTLRRAIASANRYEADCVKLEYGQNVYTFVDDDKVLGKLGHALHFNIRYELHEYVFASVSEVIGDNEDAQTLLFALISKAEKPYRELVWFILSRLTSNKLIQIKIKELGVTFLEMMDPKSFYKQLFCLMVIHQLKKQEKFEQTFKTEKPNELLRVLIRNAAEKGDLLNYFSGQDPVLVLHYTQLMLELIYAFRAGKTASQIEQASVVHVLDLLFLYAKHVTEDSEIPHPSVPHCTWQIILEYADLSDFVGLRNTIATYRNLEELMFFSLQRAKNNFFSSQMKDFFQHASEYPLNLYHRISEILISVLPDAIQSTNTSKEYFSLLSKLIKQQAEIDYSESFPLLFKFLEDRNPEEHAKAEDKGMTGALKLMRAMVSKCPKLITQPVAEYVLLTCLIDLTETHESQSNKPKCKSTSARLAGFKLLAAMAENEEVRGYILGVLSRFQSDISWRKPKLVCWLNAFNAYEKSTTGFVGIRNLGCTCYMNSMLQQLFMVETFRSGLFECETLAAIPKEENILYQLQRVMAGLHKSDKMFIQARGLCAAYTNWEGQPINTHEQMDVDEFFNGLMDKIEEVLKSTGKPKLVEEHFRGILTTQCIGKGSCAHRSERDEPFLTIPLEIKNKRSIIESLEALTVGEVLEGDNAYACDYCNAKVTAKRRLCIRSLPNILIFALRRFDFDMDTMNRVKLNNYCEFPMTLNMEPYTLEAVMKKDVGKDQEEGEPNSPQTPNYPGYYQYSLRGIIIHLGFAEAGHYYSYIIDKKTGKWMEFNDSNVDSFSPENIPSEAFGVMDKISGGISHEEVGKLRNAYVLLYERSEKYMVKGKDDPVPVLLTVPSSPQVSRNVQELLEHVHASNQKYWRKKRMFSPEFSHFVLSLAQKPTSDVLKYALCHYFTVQIRCKEPALKIMKCLYENVPQDPSLSLWFLEMLSFEPMLRELIFDCPLNEMKKFTVGLADRCLRVVTIEQQKAMLRRLMNVLGKLPDKITTQHAGFFELLYRLSLINPEAVQAADLPSWLLASMLHESVPVLLDKDPEFTYKDINLGRENEPIVDAFPASQPSFSLSYTYQVATLNATSNGLSQTNLDLLTSPSSIAQIIKGAHGKFGANQTARLYIKLIANNPEDSIIFNAYSKALIQELRSNDYDQHKSPLIQLKRLIISSDPARATAILKGVAEVLLANLMYIRATESLIGFLYRLVSRFPIPRKWVNENLQLLAPLGPWKQKYQAWSSQSATGLYLTKVYSPQSIFTEYHPSTVLVAKISFLLSNKIPDLNRDLDSDDDLYEHPVKAGGMAEFCPKEESSYRVEVVESFGTTYYVRYDGLDQGHVFFLAADDDRLMPAGIKYRR